MGTLTIRLDDKLEKELEKVAKEQHRSKSEVVREMLRESMLRRKFERARAKLLPLGEAAGYLTDEDVFQDVS